MAFPVEPLEQQRRSIAMLRPGAKTRVLLELEREVAIDVIGYAITLSQIRRTPKFVDDDGEEQVA
jgi:hypothetical protein